MEVALIDYMGDDLRVANAARVSFRRESSWVGFDVNQNGKILAKELGEQDIKLIRYLAKHNHWTPFSHVMITMREKVPIFVARQRFKHMVGFTYNEVSRRYVDDAPDFFVPDVWRSRPDGFVKQGSGQDVIGTGKGTPFYISADEDEMYYGEFLSLCETFYTSMIKKGVAPEQARMVLPQSMYTEYYVTGSLAAWARAYKLRIDSHAQKEIQDLAKEWGKIIEDIPELQHSWKALTIDS